VRVDVAVWAAGPDEPYERVGKRARALAYLQRLLAGLEF
jgi:hypothetical protein